MILTQVVDCQDMPENLLRLFFDHADIAKGKFYDWEQDVDCDWEHFADMNHWLSEKKGCDLSKPILIKICGNIKPKKTYSSKMRTYHSATIARLTASGIGGYKSILNKKQYSILEKWVSGDKLTSIGKSLNISHSHVSKALYGVKTSDTKRIGGLIKRIEKYDSGKYVAVGGHLVKHSGIKFNFGILRNTKFTKKYENVIRKIDERGETKYKRLLSAVRYAAVNLFIAGKTQKQVANCLGFGEYKSKRTLIGALEQIKKYEKV